MKPKKSRPQLPLPYLIPADFRLPESLLNQAMVRVAILLNRGICKEFYWVCNNIYVEGKVDVSFDAAQLAIRKHEEAGRLLISKKTKTKREFCEQAQSYYTDETNIYYVVPNDLLFKWWAEQEIGDANAKSSDKATELMPAKRRKGRPSKNETDRDTIVLSALVIHHGYESNGSIGRDDPATVRGLADKNKPQLTTAAISRFFKRKFSNGHKGYVVACRKREIGRLLTQWQGDESEGHADLRPDERDRSEDD